MNQYQVQMKRLLDWCQACDWSAASYYALFSRIYFVRHYEAIWLQNKSSFVGTVAHDSLQRARKDLGDFMQTRCLPDEVKIAVLYLVQNNN